MHLSKQLKHEDQALMNASTEKISFAVKKSKSEKIKIVRAGYKVYIKYSLRLLLLQLPP